MTALQSVPQIQALPPRLRQMLALLLAHQAAICQPDSGCLELHFYRDASTDTVKAKLIHTLKP